MLSVSPLSSLPTLLNLALTEIFLYLKTLRQYLLKLYFDSKSTGHKCVFNHS